MIIYATKQTVERYNLKMPHEQSYPLDELVKAVIDKEGAIVYLNGARSFYTSTEENAYS